jgi:hypothetical protein
MNTTIFTLPDSVTNASALETLKRDTLLEDANDGVLWLVDAAKTFSWNGATPASANTVKSLTGANDSTFLIQSGQSIGYAGGGFNFATLDATAANAEDNYLSIPSAVASNIYSAANDYFLIATYFRLPAEADWCSSGSTILPMLQWSATGYGSEADFLVFNQNAGLQLQARRQTSVGVATWFTLTIPSGSGHFGSVAQVAFWRDSTGCYFRLKTATGTISASSAVSTNNSANFSTCVGRIGVSAAYTNLPADTGLRNAVKFRFYRGWVENLITSNRTATTVLDADYIRTIARGVFS